MTVSNQNPTTGSQISHGASFSFDLDDGGTTPSVIQVSIEGSTTTIAWTLAGGFQAGYSGTAVKVGDVYTITIEKDAGWSASPFTVNVDWTISGTAYTSSWSYTLYSEVSYPNLMQPRNPLALGGATLDSVINTTEATPDNDIEVPAANPVRFATSNSTVTPLTVENTDTSYDEAADAAILSVKRNGVGAGGDANTDLNGGSIRFSRTGAGPFTIKAEQHPTADTAGLGLTVEAGQAGADSAGGADGGDLTLKAGAATGSNDSGRISLEQCRVVRTAAGFEVAESAADPDVVTAGYGKLWVKNDTPNRLMFTDDAGTDFYVVLPDGKTDVDAFLLTERADHVNTPAAGKGELWVQNTTPCRIMFTDDAGTDHDITFAGSGDVTGPASATDNAVTRYDGTTGKILQNSDVGIEDDGELVIKNTATDPCLSIYERGSSPASLAGYGKYWVRNTTPCTPVFRTDASDDIELARKTINVHALINTDGTVNQWYSWNSSGPYHDEAWETPSGGTGTTPTMATSWAFPGFYFPNAARIMDFTATVYTQNATTYGVSIKLMGQAVSDGQVAAGTAFTHATNTFVTAAAQRKIQSAVLDDDSINAGEMLYIFVRETTGNASRLDWGATFTLTYYELS